MDYEVTLRARISGALDHLIELYEAEVATVGITGRGRLTVEQLEAINVKIEDLHCMLYEDIA